MAVTWNASVPAVDEMVFDFSIQNESLQGLGSIAIFCDSSFAIAWDNGVLGSVNSNLQNGNYGVVFTNPNGCSVDTVFTVLYNEVSSVEDRNEFWLSRKKELLYKGSRTLHDVVILDRTGRTIAIISIVAEGTTFQFEVNTEELIIHSFERNFIPRIQID